jgi:hypothetical protein
MEVQMAAHTISATEDFVRGQFNEAIEEHRHLGPVAKAILNVLLTETTSHVGQDELRGGGISDANRYVVKLALATLTERYSMASVTLVLNLS